MPLETRLSPFATALLALACGGGTAGIAPVEPEPAPDAGPAPDTAGIVIQDAPVDAGVAPAQAPPAKAGPPPPEAEPAAAVETGAPPGPRPTAAAGDDTPCARHYGELMDPPAAKRPPIDCGRLDRLVYWRWTSAGGCRDVARLSLRRGGAVAIERGGRGPARTGEKTISPSESAAVLQAACAAFNADWSPEAAAGCPAGSRLVEFFDGPVKSGSTGALSCDNRAMAGALDRLDRLLDRL